MGCTKRGNNLSETLLLGKVVALVKRGKSDNVMDIKISA